MEAQNIGLKGNKGYKRHLITALKVLSTVLVLAGLFHLFSSDKADGRDYAKQLVENYKKTEPYLPDISKELFKTFPDAKSILVGNVYIDDNNYVVDIKPSSLDLTRAMSNETKEKVQKEGESVMYLLRGHVANGSFVVDGIKPFIYRTLDPDKISDEEWTFDTVPYKLFAFIGYPFMKLMEVAQSSFRSMDAAVLYCAPNTILKRDDRG